MICGKKFFLKMASEEKNPQTIEIYDLWEKIFLKTASYTTLLLLRD